jgi:hypothetical protein
MTLSPAGNLSVAGSLSVGSTIATAGANGLTVNGRVVNGTTAVTTITTTNPNWQSIYTQAVYVTGSWAVYRILVDTTAAKMWDYRQDGHAYSTGNWVAGSDGRVKIDREVIENALDKVESLTGMTYTRTDMGGARCVGLIAQEVKAVLPEAVHVDPEPMGDEEGFNRLSYDGVTALLVNAVKELRAEVRDLRATINGMEARNV